MNTTCPQCGSKNERDIFCSHCGTKLVEDGGVPTMLFGDSGVGGTATSRLAGDGPTASGGARVNLHLVRSGQILPVGSDGEYIVGRVSDGQSVLPDIDLEPYNGYESGVSRLHVRIRIDGEAVWITDLGSANGTQINNKALSPHQDYRLGDKDMLRLGKLSIQALVAKE